MAATPSAGAMPGPSSPIVISPPVAAGANDLVAGRALNLSSPCLNPDFHRDANLVGRRPLQGRYNAPQEGG